MEKFTIVSGGQTGADRAGLDFAICYNIPHRGWCPKGRKAEDGVIPPTYQLRETPSEDYEQRTEWNARDSDGTVIFTIGKELTGGSKLTAEFANRHAKPLLHLYTGFEYTMEMQLIDFVSRNGIAVLNIAGSRASKEPQVYRFAFELLKTAFDKRPEVAWLVGEGEG